MYRAMGSKRANSVMGFPNYRDLVLDWTMGRSWGSSYTVIPVWNMATRSSNFIKELIFHWARGSQYASSCFTEILNSCIGSVKQFISRKGYCWEHVVVAASSLFQWFET